LLLSFGGPEKADDVLPFLRNVTKGRGVPDERLAAVAEQYALFGGRSPINDQCRALVAACKADLAANGIDLEVYWGNRNWHPFVADTVAQMATDGVTHAAVFVTSAFGSYSGCRQYREDLAAAAQAVGVNAPLLTKLRLYYNHPGFIEAMAASLDRSLAGRPSSGGTLPPTTRVVFAAHSIPQSMAQGCDYVAQLHEAAQLVADASTHSIDGYDLAFQSRSGPPAVPWLEPDINDHLEALAQDGIDEVVLVPVGFVSDHMEVLYDLDTQAAATAARLGVTLIRVATVGTDPRFVAMIRELVAEQREGGPRLYLGQDGPWPDRCPPEHCPPPRRRP
ncbi:MAG: ferrochelatase, partial [Acidimicrobiia bacterium]|nr:ferrochelatase [Acidimicrobiia bacterium]